MMADDWKTRLLQLHNEARAKAGREPLTIDAKAELFAQDTCNANAAANRVRPQHGNLAELKTNRVQWVGENIAAGQTTPEIAMTCWLVSDGHRRNVLSRNFARVGFGRAVSRGRIYWAAAFVGCLLLCVTAACGT